MIIVGIIINTDAVFTPKKIRIILMIMVISIYTIIMILIITIILYILQRKDLEAELQADLRRKNTVGSDLKGFREDFLEKLITYRRMLVHDLKQVREDLMRDDRRQASQNFYGDVVFGGEGNMAGMGDDMGLALARRWNR